MLSGSRCIAALLVLALLLAVPAQAALVINEIDYDQPLSDTAEFIELYNSGPGAVALLDYSVVLINGNGGAVYNTYLLPDVSLAAGEFFVLCANSANTPNCSLQVTPPTDMIQNGAPDAVALYDAGSALIDAVSYEGDLAGYVEGSGVGLVDGSIAFQSIARYPDGNDTDQNNVDFTVQCSTPGWPNPGSTEGCQDPLPTEGTSWDALKALYRH